MLRRHLVIALLALAAASPLQAQTLKVGVTATGVPFTFLDTATQKSAGAMVDLAAAVARRLA